jgi:uncharacterized protein (DUF3084 family)
MEQPTLVPLGAGEPNLTPGEQRILLLLEQGQRRMERMEQRLQSLEEKLNAQDQRLQPLKLNVDHEAAASKRRDQELSAEIQSVREAGRDQEIRRLETVHRELNLFRREVSERFAQHNMRLEVLERKLAISLNQPPAS